MPIVFSIARRTEKVDSFLKIPPPRPSPACPPRNSHTDPTSPHSSYRPTAFVSHAGCDRLVPTVFALCCPFLRQPSLPTRPLPPLIYATSLRKRRLPVCVSRLLRAARRSVRPACAAVSPNRCDRRPDRPCPATLIPTDRLRLTCTLRQTRPDSPCPDCLPPSPCAVSVGEKEKTARYTYGFWSW